MSGDPMVLALVALALAALAALAIGLGLGLAYFAALRVNVRLYLAGEARMAPVALHVLRIAAVAVAAIVAARFGAAALLGGLAGFLLARVLSVRPARTGERMGEP